MDEGRIARNVVESLRKGTPPQRGVSLYSVGNESLIDGVNRRLLGGIADGGLIRFVSGSWGSGKTHLFRQLRETAFEHDCLVSSVELNVDSAALNKFQTVFASIVREIRTPTSYMEGTEPEAAPFGTVVREALAWLAFGTRALPSELPAEAYSRAVSRLMGDHSIDIDFKKMVVHYWETFLPDAPEQSAIEQARGEILQWFCGEGTVGAHRRRFGVNKLVSRENAKEMLRSLAGFVRLADYAGLVILFDEAEQSYSVMRKSALHDAQSNLLSLINNIESLTGLFLVYATTPDFYVDQKHGIVIYGALAGRIGKPDERAPRALDRVWNLDAVETSLEDYKRAALKIRRVYLSAYPEDGPALPDEVAVADRVEELYEMHPAFAAVRFWRVLVTALIEYFTDSVDGISPPTEQLYDDVMDRLREQ
jgi:hypothetical protein